jgi:ATP-dependent DNA helicase RecQ
MQREIILSALDKKDTLALLPTGGGKSVCFQVPALAMEGLCVVVTPLIALMKDQVEGLKKKNIKAAAIYSGMTSYEIDVTVSNAKHGDLKFLYLSPERLETDIILQNIEKMRVSLLAVDEAHCISQWGYDFRPAYLNIANIRDRIPGVPVLALTATATPLVVDDIQEKLKFREKNVYQQSFERKNLAYVVQKEENKMTRLLRITGNIKGSGIVYVRNRRGTVEIADFLNKNKVSADYYHAGLDNRTRSARQENWMHGKTRVMVSTNAFGMGIDKPDVRFVVHLDVPDSLEAYFQEAGRGGRDGKQSWAAMLYDSADLLEAPKNLERQFPEIQFIRQVYHALGNYFQLAIGSGKDTAFDFDYRDFCSNYNLDTTKTRYGLKFLEKEGYIMISDLIDTDSKVFISAKKEDLYKFQVENVKFDKFIKTLLRSYTGLFTEFVNISEDEIAKRIGGTTASAINMLNALQQYEILRYKQRKSLPQLVFLTERLDGRNISLSAENYSVLLENSRARLAAILQYLNNNTKCRSIQLLAYFGEQQSVRCGKCDVCIERNKIELSELEFDTVLDQIKPLLKQGPLSLKELAGSVKGANEEKIIKVVQWLLDNEKISYDKTRKLSWK